MHQNHLFLYPLTIWIHVYPTTMNSNSILYDIIQNIWFSCPKSFNIINILNFQVMYNKQATWWFIFIIVIHMISNRNKHYNLPIWHQYILLLIHQADPYHRFISWYHNSKMFINSFYRTCRVTQSTVWISDKVLKFKLKRENEIHWATFTPTIFLNTVFPKYSPIAAITIL